MIHKDLVVYFRNKNQVVLYECELKGQISDGQWENTRPYRHYEQPCSAIAKVTEGGKLGTSFYPLFYYGFSNPGLVQHVKHRMIFCVKFYNVFPTALLTDHYTFNTLNDYHTGEISFNTINQGMKNSNDIYWKNNLLKIESELNVKTDEEKQEVCKKIIEYNYNEKDLKSDLRDMSRIWRSNIGRT